MCVTEPFPDERPFKQENDEKKEEGKSFEEGGDVERNSFHYGRKMKLRAQDPLGPDWALPTHIPLKCLGQLELGERKDSTHEFG